MINSYSYVHVWKTYEKLIFLSVHPYYQNDFLKFLFLNASDCYSNSHTISFQKMHVINFVQFIHKKNSCIGLWVWIYHNGPPFNHQPWAKTYLESWLPWDLCNAEGNNGQFSVSHVHLPQILCINTENDT